MAATVQLDESLGKLVSEVQDVTRYFIDTEVVGSRYPSRTLESVPP